MSNRVIPAGSINPNSTIAPGVVVLESLIPGNINGIPTNLIGIVGSGSWGPVNAPSLVSTPADYSNQFGYVQTPMLTGNNYDMGTFVNAAYLQGAVANYICVRVTDGTDMSAVTRLLDTQILPDTGAVLSGKYTGTTGNSLQATLVAGNVANSYTLTIGRPGYAAEVFSNIDASQGAPQFWTNLISAVNNGQSGIRGPSNLVNASPGDGVDSVTITDEGSNYSSASVAFTGGSGTGAAGIAVLGYAISSVTVTLAGSYSSIPIISATVGTGATFSPTMKAVNNTVITAQSGSGSYAPADTITLTGGTFTTAAVLTVINTQVVSATISTGGSGGTNGTQTVTGTTGTGTLFQASVTISGGSITAINSITVPGNYTVNPSSLTNEPVTGAGLTGAALSLKMGVLTASTSTAGSYTVLPTNPVVQGSTSGSGTGATFNLLWGINTIVVTTGGINYDNTSLITISGSGGATATITLAATGGVKAITMTNHGINYTSIPTVVITGNGSGATGTAVIGSSTLPSTTNNIQNPYLFTGGADGNTGLTGVDLVGINNAIPTGMYCLANSDVTMFALVGNFDTTTYSAQDAFAALIASQAILVGPPSQTIVQAAAAKSTAGISDNSSVFLVGDWVNWLDVNNQGIVRLISPQCFYGGLIGNLDPSASPLNKIIYGIVSTQKSSMGQVYSDGDIVTAMQNGLEVIAMPSPGGNYFSAQTGKSGGTNLTTNNVNVQRMANFLSISFDQSGVLGAYIGQLQTPTVQQSARAALVAFLQNLIANQQIQTFQVVLDSTNNPTPRVQLGFMQANVTVQLFSVIIVFLIDLNVGTSQIQSITTAPQS